MEMWRNIAKYNIMCGQELEEAMAPNLLRCRRAKPVWPR